MKKRSICVYLLILLLIAADQALKVWVKTHLSLGEQIAVLGKWFSLHYIENEGIAFGMVFWSRPIGKVLLTLFRLFASGFILWAIHKMLHHKEKLPFGFILCSMLVFAGALGNVTDCVFYGRLFSYSDYYGPVASMFPEAGGYAPFFQGKVVDMLQFDLFDIPLGANRVFHFFPAIFNLADAYITTGLLVILVFYGRVLSAFVSSFDAKKEEESC